MGVVRDLKIRLSVNAQIFEQQERGSEKPGKDARGASHLVAKMPEIVVDEDEWNRRLSDASLVLHEGWELDNDGPPKAVTEGIQFLTKNSVTFNGRVSTHGQTTCGFVYGLTKEVNTSTVDAIQSPVGANLDDVFVRNGVVGLIPGSKYYYRAWANTAGLYTRYGTVRSFTTPLV
jgi:hypothetical protein